MNNKLKLLLLINLLLINIVCNIQLFAMRMPAREQYKLVKNIEQAIETRNFQYAYKDLALLRQLENLMVGTEKIQQLQQLLDNTPSNCPICLEIADPNDEDPKNKLENGLKIYGCNLQHVFHSRCIKNKDGSLKCECCPFCRQKKDDRTEKQESIPWGDRLARHLRESHINSLTRR